MIFKVVNGTFKENGNTTLTQDYVLGQLNEETGNWEAIEGVTIGTELEAIPTPKNNKGYTVDNGWDTTPELSTPVTAGTTTYTYSYAIGSFDYTVKYYYETEVGGGYEEDTDAAETERA